MSEQVLKLKNPLLVNGVPRTDLQSNVDDLTVEELAAAENYKVKISGSSITSNFAQADYLLHVCIGMQAVIAVEKDITEDDLKRLKKYDVVQLASIGMNFFLESEESDQKPSEKPQEDMQGNSTVQSKTVTNPLS